MSVLDRLTPAKLAEWNASPWSPADWQPSWGPAPRWGTTRTPSRATLGGLAADVSAVLGKPVFPWQAYTLDVTLELELGRWAWGLAAWYVVRRAGKTVGIAPIACVACSQKDPAQVWLTAQKRDNAVARWRDAVAPVMLSDLAPKLRRLISNSHEVLEWPNSSTFRPFSPDEESMHGEDPDVIFRDEDWSFTLEQAAMVEAGYAPAWSVKHGLEIRMSAAGTARSTAMKATRVLGRRAVETGNRSMAYFEWCIPEQGPDGRPIIEMPDDMLVELMLLNHPRRGRGVREDYIAKELDTNRRNALRAYGGLDNDDELDEGAISTAVLEVARARTPIPEAARLALAVEVDPDSLEGSLAVGWLAPGGATTVEAIDRRPGVRWLRDAVVSLVDRQPIALVAVVQAGPSRGVADELAQLLREDVLLRVPAEDYAAGCKRFRDTLTEQQPERVDLWLHDPQGWLWAAARDAEEKPLRSGLGWRPRSPAVPVSMMGAAALAYWAAGKVPAPAPAPRFRIG